MPLDWEEFLDSVKTGVAVFMLPALFLHVRRDRARKLPKPANRDLRAYAFLAVIPLVMAANILCNMKAYELTLAINVVSVKRLCSLFSVLPGWWVLRETNIRNRLFAAMIIVGGTYSLFAKYLLDPAWFGYTDPSSRESSDFLYIMSGMGNIVVCSLWFFLTVWIAKRQNYQVPATVEDFFERQKRPVDHVGEGGRNRTMFRPGPWGSSASKDFLRNRFTASPDRA